jgi:hypothetical protein
MAPQRPYQRSGRVTTRAAFDGSHFSRRAISWAVGATRNRKTSKTTSSRTTPLEDLLEWRDSPEGQQYAEFADVLCDLMEGVDLDAAQRRFIWPDGQRLDLDQSAACIHKQYPDARRDWIEEYLIGWIEMGYAPEKLLSGTIRRARPAHRAMGRRPSPPRQDIEKQA